MDDLRDNAPIRYQRTLLAEGQDPTVSFSVAEWGLLVQDQIDAGKGLTMRFGIRVDVPHVLDSPDENSEILDFFGYSTADVPSGTFLISPRWGFNWQSEGELRTQVRGGVGVFSGQIPFVWVANAFHNNGIRSMTRVCDGRWNVDEEAQLANMFDAHAASPTLCRKDSRGQELRTVVVFDDGFRYPQNFRYSAAVDQDLTPSISMSLGFLFNHALRQVVLEDLNLGDPAGDQGSLRGYGGFERRRFGRTSPDGFRPNPEFPKYSQVLLAKNENSDLAFSLTAELRGRISDRLNFQTGYTFSRSQDKMSLTFNDMVSNLGLNPISGDPNEPPLQVSDFDRPHKFVATVFGTPFPGLEDTHVSLLYTGQSGVPFSYVYRGDLNGDGFPGPGAAFDRFNDLLYVPDEASEVPTGIGTLQLLGDALRNDPCMAANRGFIMPRNDCRSPFRHRLDLRVAQTLRRGDWEVRLEADMINLLNLLNADWGTVQTVPRPEIPLLEPVTRSRDGQILISNWAGAVLPTLDEEGRLRTTAPWVPQTPESQWQAQFGVRVTFGGSR